LVLVWRIARGSAKKISEGHFMHRFTRVKDRGISFAVDHQWRTHLSGVVLLTR
jgi:hypothetical protein